MKNVFLVLGVLLLTLTNCDSAVNFNVDDIAQNQKHSNKSKNGLTIMNNPNVNAYVIGDLHIDAFRSYSYGAVLSGEMDQSGADEIVSIQWYMKSEFDSHWLTLGGETGYYLVRSFEIIPPDYSIIYYLKVDITTVGNGTYTSDPLEIEATYNPGWDPCEHLGFC